MPTLPHAKPIRSLHRSTSFLARVFGCAIALAASAPYRAYAGLNVWTTAGPEGVGVNDVAPAIIGFNPDIPYPMESAAERRGDNLLLAVPLVYVGTAGKGVFRSFDMGASWQAANADIEHTHIKSLHVNPLRPATVFAASPNRGVFRTDDAGESWQAVNSGLASASAHLLAADEASSTLYVTSNDGLYVSHDRGENWMATTLRTRHDDAEHSDFSLSAWIDCLAVDPHDGTVYACFFSWGSPAPSWQLLKSCDGGTTWEGVAIPTAGGPVAIAIDPYTPSTLYVGTYDPLGSRPRVLKSSDGGASWTAFSLLRGCGAYCRISALTLDADLTPTLYAATDSGVYSAMTDRRGWTPFNTGMAGLQISDIAVDVAHHGVLYAGAPEGAFTIFHQSGMCSGDCNGDGAVRVSELVAMVDIALDRQGMATCGAADSGGDGRVAIDEIVRGIASALSGCVGT